MKSLVKETIPLVHFGHPGLHNAVPFVLSQALPAGLFVAKAKAPLEHHPAPPEALRGRPGLARGALAAQQRRLRPDGAPAADAPAE